jgi:5'-nucleotidase
MDNPRILITNDDGIDVPGIKLLEEIACSFSDDVWVVAPSSERSGASHSISLTNPIRAKQRNTKHFEVDGTPTDCVLMALWNFMKDAHPDVILSGINSGANLAEDVSYSGTIAAAMEGSLMGIRSISLSQVRPPRSVADFSAASKYAPEVIQKLMQLKEWPEGSLINVNFPDCAADVVAGIAVTSQGHRPPGSFSIESRTDARNQPYYWVRITHTEKNPAEKSDLEAISNNKVSVTAIKMDFTDQQWNKKLKSLIND